MDVLVDYYNIPEQERRKGLTYLISRIMSSIGSRISTGDRRVDLRLYGGWYEETSPTRDAQRLERELPGPTLVPTDGDWRPLVVNVELAYSMRCDPAHHILYTLRSKTAPRWLEFTDPTAAGCAYVGRCPLRPGFELFVRGDCPEQDCPVTSRLIVRRREQKLVDTMLAADVFFNVRSNVQQIAVVSSDDDLWPAINTALQFGVDVIHLQTVTGHTTRRDYLRRSPADYTQLSLLHGVE